MTQGWLAEDTKKYCTHCGVEKTLGEFHFDINMADGYKDVCKECRSIIEYQERKDVDPPDQRLLQVDRDLADAVATIPAGGTCSPHMAEIGEALMRRCGGVDGFARLYMAHIYNTKPGSPERGKSLRDIMSLHIKLSVSGGDRVETMSEEDLNRIMSEAIQDYQQKLNINEEKLPVIGVTPKKDLANAD